MELSVPFCIKEMQASGERYGFLKGKALQHNVRVGLGWFLANKSSLKHNIFYCIINQKSMLVWKKERKKKTILLISNSESKHRKLILAYELYDKNHFDDKQINNQA